MMILVTGGAGFIGSNFVRWMLEKHNDAEIINADKLTYAGNLENLEDVEENRRYKFVKADISDRTAMESLFQKYPVTSVINFAAESHVDRSILGAAEFIKTNVSGANVLLELAKEYQVKKFIQISTDEVYGSLGNDGKFTEETPLHPSSPYSASKASADLLALASYHTFGIPVVVTRCSNNYGPYQFPEKLIPLMIVNALGDKQLPVYGDGLNVRDWLHVYDHCSAIDAVMQKGKPGEVYNIGGNNEWKNVDIVRLILKYLGKPESLISFVKDRLGHDRRYAIDSKKIQRELQWQPTYTFEKGLTETIGWYVQQQDWWKKILSGEYQEYYRRQYETR